MTKIPQDILDRSWRAAVHVKGWNPATRFFHVKTVGTLHTVKTSKGATYYTTNDLLYTKRYEP